MRRTGIMPRRGRPERGRQRRRPGSGSLRWRCRPPQFQITSDAQAADHAAGPPSFFGAGGGPKMAAGAVELAGDLTSHAVIGLGGLTEKLPMLRRLFRELLRLAAERSRELIILVDFGGFNLRLARAIRNYGPPPGRAVSFNWQPKIVQFISPQVWASRPWRANRMARDYDLILSLFPFEKKWFAGRTPRLPVVNLSDTPFSTATRSAAGWRFPRARNPTAVRPPPPAGQPPGRIGAACAGAAQAAGLIAARQQARFKEWLCGRNAGENGRRTLDGRAAQDDLQTGALPEALSSANDCHHKTGRSRWNALISACGGG